MSCEAREAELLQGLATETLDEAEREAAVAHVSSCAECRADLEALREMVGDLRALHLTTSEVVQAAWSREGPKHLADCATCRDEVALVRRVNEDLRGRPRRFGLAHGLAASLAVAAVGLAAWNLELRARRTAAADEVARLRAELARGDAVRSFRVAPRASPAPQLNVPIVDLQPAIGSRGAPPPPHLLEFPAGVEWATLVLVTRPMRPHPSYVLEVRDAGGKTIWRREGLRRSGYDTLTLSVPRTMLPDGWYRFILYGTRDGTLEHLEEYALGVRQR